MNKFITLLLSLSIVILFSCAPKEPKYMALDDIEYITEFPQTFMLQNRIETDIDIIGIKNFVIYDSIMILSTKNNDELFSIVSLPECKYLGGFLQQGDGPLNFIYPPSIINELKLGEENSELTAFLYDFQKGKLLKVNINNLITNKEADIINTKKSLPPFSFNFIMVDSTMFLCREVNNNQTKQVRYILDNGNKTTTPILEQLNQASIKEGEDINILSSGIKMNFDKKLIVEMPIRLNYINIYSLDGLWGKTICLGNELFDIDNIQDTRNGNRILTYSDLRVFSNFFGLLSINEERKIYHTSRVNLPKILLFDWDGKPLAELKLDNHITSFDIDFNAGELYTFDNQTDEFFKYDIKDILNKL